MADLTPGNAPPVAPAMPRPPAPQVPPGNTGPATVAPDMAGRTMEAHLEIAMALDALERAAGKLGGSKDQAAAKLLKHVLDLRKEFGANAAPDLQRAQLKTLGQGIPPLQTPTPQQGQAFGDAAKKMMTANGVPGAAA